jgi:hypothetical protein
MSEIRYEVGYAQLGDADRNGEITFNGQTLMASGRLDVVGAAVMAEGFVCGNDDLVAAIEVTRVSAATLDVLVRLSRRFTDDVLTHGLIHEARLEGVPLVTLPAGLTSIVGRLRALRSAAERGSVVRAMGREGDLPPAAGDDPGTTPA